MSQASTVATLATRELWMTFRLLLVLLVSVGAGAVVGLVPAPLPQTMTRLAAGLGLAIVVAAAVAAWSLSEERLSGRAAWLVTRTVGRGTYLFGWYGALVGMATAGLAVGCILGWLAIPQGSSVVGAAEYGAAAGAVAAALALAIAAGLLIGAFLSPRRAMILTIAACAVAALAVLPLPEAAPWLPGGALVLMARAAEPEPVLADALRAAGIGLALAAALLVVCRIAFERSDL